MQKCFECINCFFSGWQYLFQILQSFEPSNVLMFIIDINTRKLIIFHHIQIRVFYAIWKNISWTSTKRINHTPHRCLEHLQIWSHYYPCSCIKMQQAYFCKFILWNIQSWSTQINSLPSNFSRKSISSFISSLLHGFSLSFVWYICVNRWVFFKRKHKFNTFTPLFCNHY